MKESRGTVNCLTQNMKESFLNFIKYFMLIDCTFLESIYYIILVLFFPCH